MRPSPILAKGLRRLQLTTKQAGKDYYKGNRTGAMGRHTKWGGYILKYEKIRTYVMPDLTDFKLSPFVDRNVKKQRDLSKNGQVEGAAFIERWKAEGGRP